MRDRAVSTGTTLSVVLLVLCGACNVGCESAQPLPRPEDDVASTLLRSLRLRLTPVTDSAENVSASGGTALPGAKPGTDSQWDFLTGGRTFVRPLADQRWPVFSASYRFQENGRHLDQYEHLSAGDTIALARGPIQIGGREHEVELAIQGGVFSVFDAQLEQNLIVIDYVGGAYAALRRGRATGMLRFWHVSGHVGDEFLAEPSYGVDARTPYKFEAIQMLGAWELPAGLRAYGGPSVLFGVNPSEFGDVILHAGLDWRSRDRLLGVARPVAGIDVQMIDGFDFQPDVSLRAGFSFDRARRGPALQVLGELYHGRDPNGELFSDRVSFAGIGVFISL